MPLVRSKSTLVEEFFMETTTVGYKISPLFGKIYILVHSVAKILWDNLSKKIRKDTFISPTSGKFHVKQKQAMV